MRQIPLMLVMSALVVGTALADEPAKQENPAGAAKAREYVLRVERLSESDPAVPNELHRPLTVEFYVRPGVPFRCELTVGKEAFGCRGLVRRLRDGKLWLSADTGYVNGLPAVGPGAVGRSPDQERHARVGLLVEPGKPVVAEWLDPDLAMTAKSRLAGATREGVRLTLRVAEQSIADQLRQNPRNGIGLDPIPPANPGAPADRTCTIRMAIDGHVDDREAELPPPPDERLYALEIATSGPALFHARGLIDSRELVVAGRALRSNPGDTEKAVVGFFATFKERLAANVANSNSTSGGATISYDTEVEIGGGISRGPKKTVEGIERIVRTKGVWKLGAFTVATTDEDAK